MPENTLTGGRLKRVAEYVANEDFFAFTYGDGVADIDIAKQIEFHKSHGKLATVTAVQPPGRYGALDMSATGAVERVHGKTSRRGRLDQWRVFYFVS